MSTPYHFPFTLSANFQKDFYTKKFIFNHNMLLLFDSTNVNTISLPNFFFRLIFKENFTQKNLFFFTTFSSSLTIPMSTTYHFPFALSVNFPTDFYTEKFIYLHNIPLLFDSTNVNTISLPFYSFRQFSKILSHRKIYFSSQHPLPL